VAGDPSDRARPRRPRRRRQLAAIAFLIVGLLTWGWLHVAPKAAVIEPHRKHRTDFTVYTAAARAVLSGEDIYSARNVRGWPYLYPPAFAILMTPFASLPPKIASYLWFLISLSMWAASGWLIGRTLPPDTPGVPKEAAAWAMAYAAICALDTLGRGQVNLLVLLMACLMLYALSRRRDVLAGLALATAACIKVMPILVAGVLGWMWLREFWRGDGLRLWQRVWAGRFFLGLAAGLVFWVGVVPIAAMGPERAHQAYAHWRQKVGAGYFSPDEQGNVFGDILRINEFSDKNQSWYRLGCMIIIGFDRDGYGRQSLPPAWQHRLRWVLGGLFAVQVILACLLAPGRWHERDRLAFYVAPTAMLVMANAMGKIAWAHSWVLVMPLVAVMCAMIPWVPWAKQTRRRRVLLVTWVATLVAWLGMYIVPPILGRIHLLLFAAYALIIATWWAALRTSRSTHS